MHTTQKAREFFEEPELNIEALDGKSTDALCFGLVGGYLARMVEEGVVCPAVVRGGRLDGKVGERIFGGEVDDETTPGFGTKAR